MRRNNEISYMIRNMLLTLDNWKEDFLYLFYPEYCVACTHFLRRNEKVICLRCRFRLPRTHFAKEMDNPVVRHFWGKVRVEAATAYYKFDKGEKVQRLIHHLKYKGRTDAGELIGELFGKELKRFAPYNLVEAIVPVPLHPSRLRQRGYNQSDAIAAGIARSLNIPFYPNALQRNLSTSTQTRKHRFERYENVNKVFSVRQAELLSGKHILLVDDVITTGSTLIACAENLVTLEGCKVSIACLACA